MFRSYYRAGDIGRHFSKRRNYCRALNFCYELLYAWSAIDKTYHQLFLDAVTSQLWPEQDVVDEIAGRWSKFLFVDNDRNSEVIFNFAGFWIPSGTLQVRVSKSVGDHRSPQKALKLTLVLLSILYDDEVCIVTGVFFGMGTSSSV